MENYTPSTEADKLISSEWSQILTKYVIELTKKSNFYANRLVESHMEGVDNTIFGVAEF